MANWRLSRPGGDASESRVNERIQHLTGVDGVSGTRSAEPPGHLAGGELIEK